MRKIVFLVFMLIAVASHSQCDTATNKAATFNSTTSVTVNFIQPNPGSIISSQVYYVRQGFTDTASTFPNTSTSKVLTGLQPNTIYRYQIRSFCTAGGHVNTAIGYFSTFAPTLPCTPMTADCYEYKRISVTKSFHVPFVADTSLYQGQLRPGAIICAGFDSLFYGWNGKKWAVMGADVAGLVALINQKVDSVTYASDYLSYWVMGVPTSVYLPLTTIYTGNGTLSNDRKVSGNGIYLLRLDSLFQFQASADSHIFSNMASTNDAMVVAGNGQVIVQGDALGDQSITGSTLFIDQNGRLELQSVNAAVSSFVSRLVLSAGVDTAKLSLNQTYLETNDTHIKSLNAQSQNGDNANSFIAENNDGLSPTYLFSNLTGAANLKHSGLLSTGNSFALRPFMDDHSLGEASLSILFNQNGSNVAAQEVGLYAHDLTTNVNTDIVLTTTGFGFRSSIGGNRVYYKTTDITGSDKVHQSLNFNGTIALIAADSTASPINMIYQSVDGQFHKAAVPTGSGGSTNSNIGSGYRLAVPGTNNIKTLFGTFGLTMDSTTNTNALSLSVDTSSSSLATWALLKKKVDSISSVNAATYVPYTGATTNVNLGMRNITTNGVIVNTAGTTLLTLTSTDGVTGANTTFNNLDANGISMSKRLQSEGFNIAGSASNTLIGNGFQTIAAGTGITISGGTISASVGFSGFTKGSIPFFGSNNVLQQSNGTLFRDSATGNIGIGTNSFDGTNPEKLLVNAGTTTSVNAIAATGSINNYLQLNIKNQSSGTSASSDIVATANNGSETTNFIDMGINSSGYTGGVMGGANSSYLYNLGNNLLIGAGTSGKKVVFLAGGTDSATNEQMYVNSTNVWMKNRLLVGASSFIGTEIARFSSNQNATTSLIVDNGNTGTVAFAQIQVTNLTSSGVIGINGTNVTGGGLFGTPNMAYVGTSNSAPLGIYNSNGAGSVAFFVGGSGAANEVARITTGGFQLKGSSSGTATIAVNAAAGTPTLTLSTTTGILASSLTTTGTLDFPSTSAGNNSDMTISLTGAAVGDVVVLGVPNASTLTNTCYTAWVSATNTVTVRFNNYDLSTSKDPSSGSFRVSVVRY